MHWGTACFNMLKTAISVVSQYFLSPVILCYSLLQHLLGMGMKDAFDAKRANFQNLSDEPLYISDILQSVSDFTAEYSDIYTRCWSQFNQRRKIWDCCFTATIVYIQYKLHLMVDEQAQVTCLLDSLNSVSFVCILCFWEWACHNTTCYTRYNLPGQRQKENLEPGFLSCRFAVAGQLSCWKFLHWINRKCCFSEVLQKNFKVILSFGIPNCLSIKLIWMLFCCAIAGAATHSCARCVSSLMRKERKQQLWRLLSCYAAQQ